MFLQELLVSDWKFIVLFLLARDANNWIIYQTLHIPQATKKRSFHFLFSSLPSIFNNNSIIWCTTKTLSINHHKTIFYQILIASLNDVSTCPNFLLPSTTFWMQRNVNCAAVLISSSNDRHIWIFNQFNPSSVVCLMKVNTPPTLTRTHSFPFQLMDFLSNSTINNKLPFHALEIFFILIRAKLSSRTSLSIYTSLDNAL